jgi:hypothetical protein
MSKYKILGIIANHTSNMIKYNISLNNISILKKYLTNIIIVDSLDEEYAVKLKKDFESDELIIKYYLIKNDNYYDFGKWTFVLKSLKETNITKNTSICLNDYNYILFINDSIIINNKIENYFIYLNNNVSSNINLYGYNDSTQIKYHYQSYFFAIKNTIIDKFINFFESKKNKIHDLESLVHNVELNICQIDPSHDCLIKIGNEYNMTKNLYWENEVLYKYLLSKQIFAFFKLKKIYDIYKEYKLTIYGYIIEDFDYNFYKSYYEDINIKNMTEPEMLEHFVKVGQFEGRKCKPKMDVLLPEYYRNILNELNILYLFDIPEDFDVYYYKKHYDDVKNLSIINTILHYINCGVYQSRRYNKTNDNNIYFNNFYINILKLNNKLSKSYIFNNDFSIYLYHILNIFENVNYKKDEISNLMIINDIINRDIKHQDENKLSKYSSDELHKLLSLIDYDIYKNIYPETIKFSYIDIINHYLKSDNKRDIYKPPIDFDYITYSKIYNDLNGLSPFILCTHYVEYGYQENRIYKIPDDFNAELYKSLYPDVSSSNLNDKQLKEHYLFVGIKTNRIYNIPNDFDPFIYQNIYADLKHLNKTQLCEHYINIGIKECRIYKIPDDFDASTYKRIYPELSIINNETELCNHYLFNGLGAGYIYKIPNDFNINLYKKIYENIIPNLHLLSDDEIKEYYLFNGIRNEHIYKLPDDFNKVLYKSIYHPELDNLNDDELIQHYLYTGIQKGYIYKLPSYFDLNKYIKIYDDLLNLDKTNSELHYLYYGIREKRIYKVPDNFKTSIYKKIYSLSDDLSEEDIKDHYLFNIKNGHIYNIPHDFNCEVYKNIYDLNNLTNDELNDHYLYYGLKNGYVYKIPTDFDPYTYYRIYENEFKTNFKGEFMDDLNKVNDEGLINHYLYKGIKENKIYKIPNDFNPQFYKSIYQDLEKLSDKDAINHYLFYGVSEKRVYKIDGFDPVVYKELYEDLRNFDDIQLQRHYIKYGIHEGRVYKKS